MTFHPRRLASLGVAAALLAGASTAYAATSSSSVLISSFSYTTSGGTLSWSDPYQSFSATALNAGGLLGSKTDGFDTEDYFFAIVGANTSMASAAVSTTTEQTFWATADTSSSAGAITNLPNKAEAVAGQSGSFMLSGAGRVTFSIGYVLDAASPGGNPLSDYGSAVLAFDISDSDGSSGGNLGDSLLSFSQALHRTGTFTLSVDLAAGETGFYNLQGNALAFSTAAAVPEPASWLLLACGVAGVAGMAGWMRQRRTPANA